MINQLLYWSLLPVVGLYAHALLKLKVQRHAPLPTGPKILVANHPSTSDPFFVALAAGQPANILIRGQIFHVPVFGNYLHVAGHIPVIPGKGRLALERARHYLEEGRTIILFPEGRLSPREGGFFQPRTGAARLALISGAPVIPIGIHLQRSGLRYIKGEVRGETLISRWPMRGPYTMTIGRAITVKGDVEDWEYVRSISRQIMERIIHLVRQSETCRQRFTGSGGLSIQTANFRNAHMLANGFASGDGRLLIQ